jgi:hypothetical protein
MIGMVSLCYSNGVCEFVRIGNPLSIFSFKNKGCVYMEKTTNNINVDQVENMNIIRYLNLDNENEAGQKSDGTWYIKSLRFNDEVDFKAKANNLNKICNEFNKKISKKKQ